MKEVLDRKIVLFYRAFEDIESASVIVASSPNGSVYHSCQAVEKVMKGYLRCLDDDGTDEYDHNLDGLLAKIKKNCGLSEDTVYNIRYLNEYTQALRYKSMKSDPTVEDAALALKRAREIVLEFSENKVCAWDMQVARDIHEKYLKWVASEYGDKDLDILSLNKET
ncbi:MAG: HEPN domain-containing protein [Oscillospiraceae bacterium]|nr:HEPN domain-containing protein [Oscillospiraceae bacterium]